MQFMTTQFNITQQKSKTPSKIWWFHSMQVKFIKYVSWQFLLFLSFLRENSFINIFFNFHIYPLPPPPSFSLHLKWTHQWKIPGRSNYNTFIYFKKQNVLLINQLYLNEAYDWTTRQQWQMHIYSVIAITCSTNFHHGSKVTWSHLVVVLIWSADHRSGTLLTSLDTTVTGDEDDSHQNEDTDDHACHSPSTENRTSTQ